MKPSNIPENYADLLTLAQRADCLNWQRDCHGLELTLDDRAADRRTCISLRMKAGAAGVAQVRTLKGYDPAKDRWCDYCEPAGEVVLPDKRGAKALLAWVAVQAQAQTGYPNPEAFSVFRRAGAAESRPFALSSV